MKFYLLVLSFYGYTTGTMEISKLLCEENSLPLSYPLEVKSHPTNKIICRLCFKALGKESTLKLHHYRYHGEGRKNVTCPVCSNTYKKCELYMHAKKNHTFYWKCNYCNANANTRQEMYKHLRIHAVYPPWVIHYKKVIE